MKYLGALFGDSRNLNLLRELTASQYKLKDQSTFFGLLWTFLNPLLMLSVLFLFFSQRFSKGVEHYGVYLLIGIVQYTHFSNGTNNAMRALLSMKALTKETVFPKELIVLSSTLSATIDFVIAMGVCLLLAYASGVSPAPIQVLLPLVVVLQFLLVTSISLILASIYPLARDIEHIYQVFLRVLLFVTPIFYTIDFIGEGPARWILRLNPLAHLVGLSRGMVLDGSAPTLIVILALTAVNILLLGAAWAIFKHFEPRIAEYV